MIIDPNDTEHIESPKVAEARAAAQAGRATSMDEFDAPPGYSYSPPAFDSVVFTSSTQIVTGGSQTIRGSSGTPQAESSTIGAATTQPTNFVYMDVPNNKIRGSYNIDPTMSIPASLLPPKVAALPESERKNLHLFSKNGSVEADVMVRSANEERDAKRQKRATLAAGSSNGSVNLRVRRAEGDIIFGKGPTPVQISAASRNGTVRVSLPPGFTGPMMLTTHNGSIKLSPTISARISTDTHDKHTKRCFVGDMSLYDGDGWYGDELVVEANNGSVWVNETDESQDIECTGKGKGKGLFSKLFG